MVEEWNPNSPDMNNDFSQANIQREKSEKAEQQNQENAARERQSIEDEQKKKKEEQDRQASKIEAERLAAEQVTQNLASNFNQENETQEIETDPISKIDLNRLKSEQEREKPTYRRDYTPGGVIEQKVHTNISQDRAARIDHIEERLNSYQNKARDDFNMTQQKQDEKEIKIDQGRSR